MFVDDVQLDSLVHQLMTPTSASSVVSVFLTEMKKRGFWDPTCVNPITIFVPIDAHFDVARVRSWDELWNIHTVKGHVHTVASGVHQITTMGHIVYAMGKDDTGNNVSGFKIGGIDIVSFWNFRDGNAILHGIDAHSLPNIRLAPGVISTIEADYISGSVIDLTFSETSLANETNGHTLDIRMTNPDRSAVDPSSPRQMIFWNGNGTNALVVIPDVATKRSAMLWFSIYDNMIGQPIFSTAIPWYIRIHPNPGKHCDIRITDINPKVGEAERELTLFGKGFPLTGAPVTVSIASKRAVVFSVHSDYVRCIIPPGSGCCTVWAAVGSVYTKYDHFTYIS